MAEDKKSFILYCDQREQFDQLTNEEAGKLIKHLFSYVNDEDPKAEFVTNLAFTPIKQQLKRDLIKYEGKKKQWSDAGKASAEARKQRKERTLTDVDSVPTVSSVTDNDTVTVSGTVNDTDIKKEKKEPVFNFRKSLISNGGNESLVIEWMQVRKNGKATNTETALKGFLNQVKLSKVDINEVLKQCVESSWKGFKADWIKEVKVKDQIPEEPDMSWYNEWKRSPEDRKAANKKWVDLGYRPKNKTTSVGVITTWHKQQPVN